MAMSRTSTARVTVLMLAFCLMAQSIALSCGMTRNSTYVSPVSGASTTPRVP